MSTVSQIGAAETAKYLMDIPSCVIPQDTDSFDSVYSDISTGDEDLDTIFEEVSKEYGVNVNLLKAVAQAESGFDSQAVSSAGAMGIMQLMPASAESLGVEDPYDARQNITGGAKMLGYLLADYNGDVTLALAAYNAGSGAVRKYGGVPPYSETENYIRKINDILGGALDNDSTTVDGAEPTPVYGTAVYGGCADSCGTGRLSDSGTGIRSCLQQCDICNFRTGLFGNYTDLITFIIWKENRGARDEKRKNKGNTVQPYIKRD